MGLLFPVGLLIALILLPTAFSQQILKGPRPVLLFYAPGLMGARIAHGDQEVERAVGIRHDNEERGFPVADGVQLQIIVCRDFPKFLNVKGSQPCTARDQDVLGRLS